MIKPFLVISWLFAFINASAAASPDVCNFVAAKMEADWIGRSNRIHPFRTDFMLKNLYYDLDGDHIPDKVVPDHYTGTMGAEGYIYKLSSAPGKSQNDFLWDTSRMLVPKEGYFLGDGWLPFGNRMYEILFSDEPGAFVAAVSDFSGGERHYDCLFQNEVTARWLKVGNALSSLRGDAEVLWPDVPKNALVPLSSSESAPAGLVGDDFKIFSDPPAGQNSPEAVWIVDFDNDGIADRLLKVRSSSSAGSGCTLEYFVLLTSDGKVAKGSRQDALQKLQQGGMCSVSYNWVMIDGRALLERKGDPSPFYTRDLIRDLSMVHDGQAATLFVTNFHVKPSIGLDDADHAP